MQSVLELEEGLKDVLTEDFRYNLDGGWPDLAEDDVVTYAQIHNGRYRGTSAMATGPNRQPLR